MPTILFLAQVSWFLVMVFSSTLWPYDNRFLFNAIFICLETCMQYSVTFVSTWELYWRCIYYLGWKSSVHSSIPTSVVPWQLSFVPTLETFTSTNKGFGSWDTLKLDWPWSLTSFPAPFFYQSLLVLLLSQFCTLNLKLLQIAWMGGHSDSVSIMSEGHEILRFLMFPITYLLQLLFFCFESCTRVFVTIFVSAYAKNNIKKFEKR